MTPHIHRVQIYYEDTDFSGVVYHANYLRYFERAREHLLGVDELVHLYRDQSVGFVVYRAEMIFKEGAKHGDTLEIRTTARSESIYRIVFDQQVWKPNGKAAMVKGTVELAAVHDEKGLVPIPPAVVASLKSHWPN